MSDQKYSNAQMLGALLAALAIVVFAVVGVYRVGVIVLGFF